MAHGALSHRDASAPDCQNRHQGSEGLVKASQAQGQTQAAGQEYSPEPTYVRQPFAARAEADSKVIGRATEGQSISPVLLTLARQYV